MDKNLIVVIVLIALIIISGVQAVELAQIKGIDKINDAGFSSQQGNIDDSGPASASNSDYMVGGC